MHILTPEGRFQYCMDVIMEHEGYLSDNKRDPGGITKWGISLRFLKAMGCDMDGDGKVDAHDILVLTQHDAEEIYRRYWWDNYMGHITSILKSNGL